MTGFTVVVRESEWLDSDVRELMELADVEANSCAGCGWHDSIADDRSNVFTPENDFCHVCAGRDQHERMEADRFRQWADRRKDARPAEPRPEDGRGRTRMTLLSPEEAERRRGGGGGNQD